MTELVAWLNQARERRRLHPLIIVALFIVVFLAIHPFQDGNGRLSTILTSLLLLQAGYAYVPHSSLESVVENSKENYHLALRQMQTTISAKLAALAALFHARFATAEAPPGSENGAGKKRTCCYAGARGQDSRLCAGSKARYHT